jgi:hypothetical protein
MSVRPLSERHHDRPDPENTYEIRIWDARGDGDAHWRTLACCARRDDAEALAGALVAGDPATVEFAEIWGPGDEDSCSRRRVLARLPEPSRDEIRDMWRRAADQNYATAYTDLRH